MTRFLPAPLLRHVLDNLVGNAIKYTRPGAPSRITISAHPQLNCSALVEVADSGIGIPATDRSKIFNPFHRCANNAGYPGGGSRFWFTIPADASCLSG